jgi:hypothetical protein
VLNEETTELISSYEASVERLRQVYIPGRHGRNIRVLPFSISFIAIKFSAISSL